MFNLFFPENIGYNTIICIGNNSCSVILFVFFYILLASCLSRLVFLHKNQ